MSWLNHRKITVLGNLTQLSRDIIREASAIVPSILGSPKGAICHPLDVQAGPEAKESERRSQCVFQNLICKVG